MSAVDYLMAKSREYDLKQRREEELSELDVENGAFPSPMPMLYAVAALVTRDVAEALKQERARV